MTNLKLKTKDFVHLHLHTDYSLLQSTIQLKPLAAKLSDLGMHACAITDYGNMYGAVSFYETMLSSAIRPILGYEAFVASGSRFDKSSAIHTGELPYYNLILLVKDLEGYRNLTHLASKAFTEGFHHKPRIDLDLLAEKCRGLIALSAGADGAVGNYLMRNDEDRALDAAKKLQDIFGTGNFFLELQPGVRQAVSLSQQANSLLYKLSRAADIPLVATNDVHYLTPEDARAHEVLLCIGEGRTIGSSIENSGKHLRSADEMWKIFGDEVPEALTNTLKIAEMCDLALPLGDEHMALPKYTIPAESGAASADDYLESVAADGFEERRQEVWEPMMQSGTLLHSLDEYRARLEKEIVTIKSMGFAGYFLIVWDFIKYARQHGIPVGPGRGSAAGSLAAYCLRITDIDPLQYDLLFERFLNPERISWPDIDIDFCIRGRADVIDHVTELYGRESVCQIITFGTMASRAAIKDVGRALNMPYADVDRIAKLIPPPIRGRNVSISMALKQVPELKKAVETDAQIRELVDLALRLEGCSRHTSVHAAGVVISPRPLDELVPVAISGKDELTSQYPMNDLEKAGMLKIDFLGLTTLTVISDCLKSLREKAGVDIDWAKVKLNDEKTMAIFGDGRTDAVFQFESSGMQEICRRLKPKELEDLSALNALYRPGPIDGGMIEDFIMRHRGERQIEYILPEMEEILSNTFGVLVYQEQIMQLAQKLAGYTLGEADMMRRAMGKKKRGEMAKHEEKFVGRAVRSGIAKKKASEIFNLMSQFADYGFNRSHSIAYAYLAFQTAYLKAHFPAHFYAAVLSHEADDSAKVYKYSNELRAMGLNLLPPDINESGHGFTPSESAVRFGLNAIKGIGTSSIASIIKARKEKPFTSLLDFVSRVGNPVATAPGSDKRAGSVNRRGLESLVAAGAFDSLRPDNLSVNLWRAKLFASVEKSLQQGQRVWEDNARGQSGLFEASQTQIESDSLPDAAEWKQAEMSRHEKAAIGFYLSTHPLDEYNDIIEQLRIQPIASNSEIKPGEMMKIAGIISGFQGKYSKKGNRFCIFRLEDRSGGLKSLMWSYSYAKCSSLLKDDTLVLAEGRVESNDGQEITLIVSDMKNLAEALQDNAREATITLPFEDYTEKNLEEIINLLNAEQGKCDVFFDIPIGQALVKMDAPVTRIQGSKRLEHTLHERGCRVNWKI